MSKLLRSLSALGYVTNGVARGLQDVEDQKRIEEDRAYMREQRDRERRLQAENDGYRTSMQAAAKPAAVEELTVPAEGPVMDGMEAPVKPAYKVNGEMVGGGMAKDKVEGDYNALGATMRRQAKVATGAGKAAEAAQLEGGADKWEADKGLKEAGSMLAARGWPAVPDIYARYNDGIKVQVEEDGKGGALVIGIDEKTGKEVRRKQYADLPQLFAEVAGRFDPKLWMEDTAKRATEAKADARYKEGKDFERDKFEREQKLKRDELASLDKYRATMAGAAQTRAGRTGGGAGGADGGLALSDMKDGLNGIASTLNADYKAQIDGAVDPSQIPAIKAARDTEIDAVQRLYIGATSAGIPITREQVIAAYRTGVPATRPYATKDGRSVMVQGVDVNGRFIPMSDQPGLAAPKMAVVARSRGATRTGPDGYSPQPDPKPAPPSYVTPRGPRG